MRAKRSLVMPALFAAAVGACQAYERSNPLDPEYPLTLAITGPDTLYSVNDTVQFQLVTDPRDAGLPFTWSTSNATRVSVVNGRPGAFASNANGTAVITVALGPHSAQKEVVVQQRPVRVLIVEPSNAEIPSLGDVLVLSAAVVDARDTPVSPTTALLWSSSDASVAEVTNGRVTARGNGSAWIKASTLAQGDSLRVTVRQVPASVQFGAPNYTILIPGGSVQTVINVRDARNNLIPSPSGLQVSSSRSSFLVQSNGFVQSSGYGSTQITARIGELQATTTVRVTGGTPPTVLDLDAGLTRVQGATPNFLLIEFTARDTELDLDEATVEVLSPDGNWMDTRIVRLVQGVPAYSASVAVPGMINPATVRIVVRDAALRSSVLTSWSVTEHPKTGAPGVQLISAAKTAEGRIEVAVELTGGNATLRTLHLFGFDAAGSIVYSHGVSGPSAGPSTLNVQPANVAQITAVGVVVSDVNGGLSLLRRVDLMAADE